MSVLVVMAVAVGWPWPSPSESHGDRRETMLVVVSMATGAVLRVRLEKIHVGHCDSRHSNYTLAERGPLANHQPSGVVIHIHTRHAAAGQRLHQCHESDRQE